ncbi:MAG: hypothetical protein GTN43_00710 [Candidatus Aenigmarchaeota archaeon]|nr:hypothetical protein [Candidatus Aenigmarchaeota archaeon]
MDKERLNELEELLLKQYAEEKQEQAKGAGRIAILERALEMIEWVKKNISRIGSD